MAKFNIKTIKPKFVVTTVPETKIDVVVNKPIIQADIKKAYFKLKNTGGPTGKKGDKGDPGEAATITVGSTSTLPAGSSASVVNSGTQQAAVLDFGIPKGDKGDKGDTGTPGAAATVAVGTTTTGNPGTSASVTNVGTSSAAVLNFTIPKGDKGDTGATGSPGTPGAAATVAVGTTTTGNPGTNASVTNSGTSSAAVFNFTIPRGDKGDTGNAATVAVGNTTTGQPGTSASVTNSGTQYAAVLDFTIPKGDKGDTGSTGAAATVNVGSTSTGNPGTNASVVNSGTQSAAVLDFTIPRGDKGDTGSAATIAVGTVTTGAAGTNASVTNVGTSSAAVFDFTIPRGDKGDAGAGSGDMLKADYDANSDVKDAGGIAAYVTAHEPTKTSDLLNDGSDGTAQYLETDETAYRTAAIPYGECDNTSTSTAFTATVPGITALRDGVCMWLKNGVVTSASGFTININNLGAKPVYQNMAAATAETTLFNVNYTMLFVYDSTRVAGGCWVLYRGYNSDTNTIAYQVRTNSTALNVTDRTRYYRLLFTSADNTQWVPANTQYDNSATSTKTVNQRKINPFGRIVYMSGTTNVTAGSAVSATVVWDQYALALGYSFNRTGAALTLTTKKPVYVKCAPQSDGSAIMDSTTPIVQDLPSTEDGKIYIYLGIAYSATNIELVINHPVYYYKDSQIREWTNAAAGISSVTWGSITGTLSSQTDLDNALSAKADTSSLATVATSGLYSDLTGTPTIPAAQVNSDWSANSGVAEILNKPSLATVATSGSYNDLTDKPTIPTGSGIVWFGECTDNASTNARSVTTTNGDFSRTVGSIISVRFNTAYTGTSSVTLNVDGTGATYVYRTKSNVVSNTVKGGEWSSGEVVTFVYTSDGYVMLEGGRAGTSNYGATMLNDTVTSTSTDLAATANAVKKVKDAIPTNISQLTNDLDFSSEVLIGRYGSEYIYKKIVKTNAGSAINTWATVGTISTTNLNYVLSIRGSVQGGGASEFYMVPSRYADHPFVYAVNGDIKEQHTSAYYNNKALYLEVIVSRSA